MNLISNFKKVFDYYKNTIFENNNWFRLTAAIFVFGIVTGLIISLFIPFIAEQALKNYASSIDTNIKPGFDLSVYVFTRNITITTVSSFLGIIFGLTSIFVTYINGIVLGVVFGYLPVRGFANPFQIFLLILPHGIFEYIGTFLAMSFGLRLGINWIVDKKGKSRKQIFVEDLKKLISIYPLVFLLLLLAALIEGTITIKVSCILGGLCN